MKKRNSITYDTELSIDNIYNMWNVIRKTCKNKKALLNFSMNLSTNIDYIYKALKNRTYSPYKYNTFMIFEPKARLVMSSSIRDKIVNHFVANYYLIPYLEKSLIDVNVATRKKRGSSYAMYLIKKYFNKILINNAKKEIYCLKIDISKYFYSINHNILIKKIEKKIYDQDIIHLVKLIISETNKDYINDSIYQYNKIYNTDIPLYGNDRGLSIGAMTSQFLAIFYLNDLNHFIKEKLKCKYYVRYMDDLIILDCDKEKLKEIWKLIVFEIEKLELSANKKSNIYNCSKGFTFLGYKYKITNNKLKISFNRKTYFKIKKKLKTLYRYDRIKFNKSLDSYWGYFSNCYTLKKGSFKMKLIDIYKLYKENHFDTLIIVKDGIFYKSFYNDAKILWYLFNYKYINDSVSFGNVPYDKVVSKLKRNDINFIIFDKEKELLSLIKEDNTYHSYSDLANKSYDKRLKIDLLLKKLEFILDNNYSSYQKIDSYLENFNSSSDN